MHTQHTESVSAFLRILWMMVGPVILGLLALTIIEQHGGWLTLPSLAYFPILGATMLGRWLEFQGGQPKTSTGDPATAADLRRYLLMTSTLGLVVWIVANVLGVIEVATGA
jgi:hypothetical protein